MFINSLHRAVRQRPDPLQCLTPQPDFRNDSSGTGEQCRTNRILIHSRHLLDSIEEQKRILKDLSTRIGKSEGLTRTAYELRYEKSLQKILELNLNFAEGAANLDQSKASEKYRQQAIQILNSQFALTADAIKRFRKQIELPEEGKSAAEQAAAYSRAYGLVASMNHGYELWFKSIEISRKFEIDVSEQEALLRDIFIERAANFSVILDHAMATVSALRASVAVMPTDTELAAQLSVATGYVQKIADSFDFVLQMMDVMEAGHQ